MNFLLPANSPREAVINKIASVLRGLPLGKAWKVETEEHKVKRSDQQNRFLWGIVYAEFLKVLPGWHAEDVHEYMLGEWSGWETLEGMGRKRLRPVRRSSSLNKQEFSDYVAFIQQKAAEHGVVIPDPNEVAW
jgi:hypothetical protein